MTVNPIDRLAFEWIARVDGGLSSTEQAELDAWLAEDNRHFGAYIRAQAVFQKASRAKAFSHSPNPDEWLQIAQLENPEAARKIQVAHNDQADFKPVSRRAFLGLAGSIAAAGLTVAYFASGQPAQGLTLNTKLGEMRDFTLQDGTRVVLNTESEIRVVLGAKLRKVQLVKGEVLFDVAKEVERPFEVDAIGFTARAYGTSFAIQQLPGIAPQIVVKDGVVDITPTNSTSMRVAQNTRVTVYSRGKVSRKTLTPAELDREIMWQEGKIAFDDTPLRNAIATYSRYGAVHIEVEDPQILRRTVTGVFSSDDPKGFANAVANVFDLQVITDGNALILRDSD